MIYRTEEDRRLDPHIYTGTCFHKPVSINAAYYRNKTKTVAYRAYENAWWATLEGEEICPEHCEDVKKIFLGIHMEMAFSNNAADLDNSLKTTIDILQYHFGFDDKQIRLIKAKKLVVPKGSEYAKVELFEVWKDDLEKEIVIDETD